MSKEVTAVKLYQPDIPFCIYYILDGETVIKVFYDPTELYVTKVSRKRAENHIREFDKAIYGGE